MNILLFGGFLGSGKTSVILQVAKYLVETRNGKVAIIENEIGETGIDDKVIGQQGLKVTGIFAGCVCCEIAGELLKAVKQINSEVSPDWLIIEATGLAVPSKIVKMLNNYGKCFDSLQTLVLVDVSRWTGLKEVVEPLVVSQLESADVILVNKIDLIDENTLQELASEYRLLNDQAAIILLNASGDIEVPKLKEMVHK